MVKKQTIEINNLMINMSSLERKAFQKLQKASAIYFKAHIDKEMDRYGTGSVAFGILEEMDLNKNMLMLIKKTIQCNYPTYNLKNYQHADNELNILYKKIQTSLNENFGITRDGIKITERAWITYKDAWENFSQTICPDISVDNLKFLITKDRIKTLKELSL